MRRELIDQIRKVHTKAVEQLGATYAGLLRNMVERLAAERVLEIPRRNLLILPTADPGLRNIAMSMLLQVLDQVAETSAEHVAGSSAAEKTAKAAFQQIAQRAARASTGTCAPGTASQQSTQDIAQPASGATGRGSAGRQ